MSDYMGKRKFKDSKSWKICGVVGRRQDWRKTGSPSVVYRNLNIWDSFRGSTRSKNNSHKDTKTFFALYTALTFTAMVQKQ